MPRLRRRKAAPERMAPAVASPVKTLFTRRSSLAGGPSLMAGFGYAAGGEEGGSAAAVAVAPQTAAEARLRHCLQQQRTQRWAAAEFLYSALDRPFFMFSPLAGLLAQLGLAEGSRLTRREWSLIRSGLGEPRPGARGAASPGRASDAAAPQQRCAARPKTAALFPCVGSAAGSRAMLSAAPALMALIPSLLVLPGAQASRGACH
jgi:hypothetical protein